MKNLVYLILILVAFGCGKDDEGMGVPGIDLSGIWMKPDAQCGSGVFYDEEILIIHSEDSIIATKLVGSACVPQGEVSFRGANVLIDDSYYEIIWTLGNPSSPSCCTAPGTVMLTEDCKLHTTWNGINVVEFFRKDFPNPIDYGINGSIPIIPQPSSLTCWAATGVMMVSWKDNIEYSFEDFFTIHPAYENEFDTNTPLSFSAVEGFYGDLGLEGREMSYSTTGIKNLLKEKGPLLAAASTRLGDNSSGHVRIIVEILGDGSLGCTHLKFIDPSGGRIYTEPFTVFTEKYQGLAEQAEVPLIYYFN